MKKIFPLIIIGSILCGCSFDKNESVQSGKYNKVPLFLNKIYSSKKYKVNITSQDNQEIIVDNKSYIQDDIATTNSVTSTIKEYLEIDNKIKFPENVKIVIIQNVLQWLQLNNVDIKWNATHILFMLTRSTENESFINNKIINLIENEGIYVKIAILRQIYLYDGISESTRNYVISKCENDPCYMVRKTCEEIKSKQSL